MAGRTKGTTDLKHQSRLEQVTLWLARGYSTLVVIEKAFRAWGVSRRSARRYVERCRKRLLRGAQVTLENWNRYASIAFAHYDEIIANEATPLELRLRAQGQKDRLAERVLGVRQIVEQSGQVRVDSTGPSVFFLSKAIRADPEALDLLIKLESRIGRGPDLHPAGNGTTNGHSCEPAAALGALLAGAHGEDGDQREVPDPETH